MDITLGHVRRGGRGKRRREQGNQVQQLGGPKEWRDKKNGWMAGSYREGELREEHSSPGLEKFGMGRLPARRTWERQGEPGTIVSIDMLNRHLNCLFQGWDLTVSFSQIHLCSFHNLIQAYTFIPPGFCCVAIHKYCMFLSNQRFEVTLHLSKSMGATYVVCSLPAFVSHSDNFHSISDFFIS